MAVHVVDALFICGTDVRQLHYNERHVLQSVDHRSISQPCLLFTLLIHIFSLLFLVNCNLFQCSLPFFSSALSDLL